jgi:ABC-type lipoprotein export system ATPase subunit
MKSKTAHKTIVDRPGIAARGLVKAFGDPEITVIHPMDLDIQKGEFVAITGRSGSGKSTLLYLLSGLDVPTSGSVFLNSRDLTTMAGPEIDAVRNTRMGFVFQFHYLLPELTAIENILMPPRRYGAHRERVPFAEELLERFGIAHCRNKIPGKMSGGECQRVAIARALVMRPEFLFADEPTGNLDSANGDIVMDIFESINRTEGTTILLVTHEPEYARRAGRQLHLVDGRVERDERIRH